MWRRAFNLLSGASLLLFIGTVVFWVRSQYVADNPILYTVSQVDGRWVLRAYSIISCKDSIFLRRSGWLEVYRDYPWDESSKVFVWKRLPAVKTEPYTLMQHLGFSYQWIQSRVSGKVVSWDIQVPYWGLAVAFFFLPAWWVVRKWWNGKRRTRGFEIESQ